MLTTKEHVGHKACEQRSSPAHDSLATGNLVAACTIQTPSRPCGGGLGWGVLLLRRATWRVTELRGTRTWRNTNFSAHRGWGGGFFTLVGHLARERTERKTHLGQNLLLKTPPRPTSSLEPNHVRSYHITVLEPQERA